MFEKEEVRGFVVVLFTSPVVCAFLYAGCMLKNFIILLATA